MIASVTESLDTIRVMAGGEICSTAASSPRVSGPWTSIMASTDWRLGGDAGTRLLALLTSEPQAGDVDPRHPESNGQQLKVGIRALSLQ